MGFDRNLLPDPRTYFEAQGLRLASPKKAKWTTTSCQFHGGRETMRINMTNGAWICMSCGEKGGDVLAYEIASSGRQFVDAAKSLGCWVDDGKPVQHQKPTPLAPRDALAVLSFETTQAAVAAGNLARGVQLTDTDRQRLLKAAGRINLIARYYQ